MSLKQTCTIELGSDGVSTIVPFNASSSSQPYNHPLVSTINFPPHPYIPLKPVVVVSAPSVTPVGFFRTSNPSLNTVQLHVANPYVGSCLSSAERQVSTNLAGVAGPHLPSSKPVAEGKRPGVDSATAIGVYRKYYTDVLAYFKTLLDNLEHRTVSVASRDQSTTPINSQNGGSLDNDPWGQSKTIMEGYFRRSGARDWDWASWHNYLSWISRTHPEWFQLFSECSKQMGIDWDVMYQKWLASKPQSSEQAPVFDLSRPPPSSTSNPQQAPPPPITNPFCLTSVPPPKDPRVWCEDCDRYFPIQRAYDIHLRGVCHIQNALTKTITKNASAVLDIPPAQWAPHVNPLPVGPPLLRNKPVLDSRPQQKFRLRLQRLLDVCIKPLVGLNYITEFQRRGLLECVYVCDLCKRRAFLPCAVIKHVCGIRHRMTFLKYHYPPLHYLMSLDKCQKSVRKRRLTSYAQQVESNEGRKRLSIMVEKENSTFMTRIEETATKDPHYSPSTSAENSKPLDTSPCIETINMAPVSTASSQGPEDTDERYDDEIEEGEMLDYSTSSSCVQEDQDDDSIRRGAVVSPISSRFSSDDDSCDTCQDESHLPSFFSTGVPESKCDIGGPILIHLPDFEVGFISERPALPNFTTTDKCNDFVDRLKKEGLLGISETSDSDESQKQERTVDAVSPTDSQLAESFEDEVKWALNILKTVEQKPNPLQFSYNLRPKHAETSTPLLPDPPSAIRSNSVISEENDGDAKVDGGVSVTKGGKNSQSDKRVVKTLLGDFCPSSSPPSLPPTSKPGQNVSTTRSSQPRSLLPQPFSPGSKREAPQVSHLGNPPKHPRPDQLDGVKNLLSSPLDALQALLKGNLNAPAEEQHREENIPSESSAPIIQSPPTSSAHSMEIFDGYSYFSRREEEGEGEGGIKTQEHAPTPKPPLLSHRQRRSITKSSSNATQGRSSKLAAFADMLGMNEPPAPPPPSRPPIPPPPPSGQPATPHISLGSNTGVLNAGLPPGSWLAPPSLWQPPAIAPAQNLAAPSPAVTANALASAASGFNPAVFLMPTNVFGSPVLRPPIWRP